MNKRQKKKKLKQQAAYVARQKNNEKNGSIDSENQSVEQMQGKEDVTKKESDTTVVLKQTDLEPLVITPGKQKNNIWETFRFVMFPMAFLILEIVMACSTRGHFFSHNGIYITLFCVGYGSIFTI